MRNLEGIFQSLILTSLLVPEVSSSQNFWQPTSLNLDSSSVWTLATNDQRDIFAGVWFGLHALYRSTNNGDTWDTLTIGYPNPHIWCIATVPNGEVFVGAEALYPDTINGGIYHSSDNGYTWLRRSSLRAVHALITQDSGRTFLAGIYGSGGPGYPGGVYRSVDSCGTWTRLNTDTCNDYNYITNLAITRQGSILAAVSGTQCGPYGIIRSTDNGQTWTRHYTPSVQGDVNDFLIPPAGDIFLSARYAGVNRSSSDGTVWSSANNGIPPLAAYYMKALGMDSSGTLYAGNDWGPAVHRSTDYGNSWSEWTSGLGYPHAGPFLYTNGYMYVGSRGVYRSVHPVGAVLSTNRTQIIFPPVPVGTSITDSITVYSQNSVPLVITIVTSTNPAFAVTPDSITITPGDSGSFYVTFTPDSVRQYTGTIMLEYNGRLSPQSIMVQGDAVTGAGEENNLPKVFSLAQNYPNPFNPTTTFLFDIPYSTFVILRVYNLLGQEVATPVNEQKQPGFHTVEWNASAHPSGVYFYILQAATFRETKKLILLR